MKKLIPISVVLLLGFWIGCGDDESTNGPEEPTVVRVIANTTVSAPTLSSADEDVWADVDSFLVGVSQANSPKLRPPEAAAYPPDIYVQAIKKDSNLYLRLQWSDLTFDAYPNHYKVTGDTIPPIDFTREYTPPAYEDQIFVMFDSLLDGGYDAWNWRVLTTGGGGLGKGCTYQDTMTAPTADAVGTVSSSGAVENPPKFGQPTYAHKNTSEFNHYILFTADTVHWDSVLYTDIDTIIFGDPPDTIFDTTEVHFWETTGWKLGQKVPGWLIDSSFASRTDEERGSRWDIKAVSVYDNDAAQYRVVLCRKLNTGFVDDINLAPVDSVKVKVGIFDNQEEFTPSSNRGFSDDFWIILK